MGSPYRIRTGRIRVTDDSVVALSKFVLVPGGIECETLKPAKNFIVEKCGIKLNCWEAFLKHQIQHCRDIQKNPEEKFVCPLKKCNKKLHRLLESLALHIEDSHLKELSCPLTICAGHAGDTLSVFTRRGLIAHLHEQHGEIIGTRIDHALLLPTSRPSPTAHLLPLPLPPSLPSNDIQPGGLFVSPVTVRNTKQLMQLISSPDTSPLPAAHRWEPGSNKSSIVPKFQGQGRNSGRCPPLGGSALKYDFDDLPDIEFNPETGSATPEDVLMPPNFVVQRINVQERSQDLVRALQPMVGALLVERSPPPSIFYPALQEQVFASYARGEGTVVDVSKEDA